MAHRTRAKSKSPQPPKMPLFSGSGKPTFEAFMYQFERTEGRKGWTGETKTCKLLDCLTDSALEYTRKVHNTSVEYNVLRADLRGASRPSGALADCCPVATVVGGVLVTIFAPIRGGNS
jgi:hypothetical protein